MRVKFEGAEADNNRLEAYEGLKSLDGILRVARIATHYAATGEVRYRAPYTGLLETQITDVQNGSFEMLFENISKMTKSIETSSAKMKADAIITRILERGTGQVDHEELLVDGEIVPRGDIDAMVEASEGGLKTAHRWINTSAKSISVLDGGDSVKLDETTKKYVEEEIMGDEQTRDVSVAALNVNNRTGRVFLFDEGRTVPFLVHRDAAGRTVTNLSKYLNKYAEKTGATVNIRFRPMTHVDDRIKRLIIFDCFDIRDAA